MSPEAMAQMAVEIRPIGRELLPVYASVPISFLVRSILRVEAIRDGLGGLLLKEEPVAEPCVKDYDSSGGADTSPLSWPTEFDMSSWTLLLAQLDGAAVGGATIVAGPANIHMLSSRDDLAVLWDIRVRPELRGHGIGTRLFLAAADWARSQGCSQLRVETQNINVPACHFYASQGCQLGAIDCYAYSHRPDLAHEAMLLWYLDLNR